MVNALKKINAEAKRLRKKHPRMSHTSAIQQASRKYRTGKLGQAKKVSAVPRKAKPKKRKAAKRRKDSKRHITAVAVREVRAVKVGRVKRRTKPRPRMAGSGRRVGAKKKSSLVPVLLAVGAGLLLWKVLSPAKPSVPAGAPPLITTSNQLRNDQSNQIVQYAMAAGLTLDAITRLIESLNQRGDQDIQYYYDEIDSGRGLPSSLYV